MSWYTDRPCAARAGAARPWLPPLLSAEPEADSTPAAPALRFDEAELARVAAGLVERTAREIRAEAAASPAVQQADALDRAVDGRSVYQLIVLPVGQDDLARGGQLLGHVDQELLRLLDVAQPDRAHRLHVVAQDLGRALRHVLEEEIA